MNERMKKIIFVVNPISGTQSKELILSLLNEKIDKARYSWEVVYTERAGHAVEIAAKAAEEKADIVVAIGGDGTINEIARSLVHTDTALGIIPWARAMDLHGTCIYPWNRRKHWKCLMKVAWT